MGDIKVLFCAFCRGNGLFFNDSIAPDADQTDFRCLRAFFPVERMPLGVFPIMPQRLATVSAFIYIAASLAGIRCSVIGFRACSGATRFDFDFIGMAKLECGVGPHGIVAARSAANHYFHAVFGTGGLLNGHD